MSELRPLEASEHWSEPSDWSVYKRLLRYVAPYWYLLAIAIVGFLAQASAEAYFGKLLGDLIQEWDNAVVRAAATIPLLMFGAAVVRSLGAVVGETFISRVSFNVVYNIRQELFQQTLDLPNRYYDQHAQGHIISRITFTVAQLRDTGTDALRAIIQDGLKVIVLLGALLWLNWQLTLLFLGTLPILSLVVVFASSRFRRISKRIQNSMGDVTHVVSEAVGGIKVVRIFGGQDYERGRFQRFNRVNRQQNFKMSVTKVVSAQINELTISIAICVLILLLYDTSMNAGQAVTFMTWAGLLGRPIRKLSEVNAKLQRGLAAAHDVFAQLDQPIEADHGAQQIDSLEGRLVFESVSFAYQEAEPVLHNVDLTIEPGQTVALVGRSGSGKSTMANLIPRFYDVKHGRILLDGMDIRDLELSSLRQQIALVSQSVTLFNDTLRANVAYGALQDVSEAQIEDALQQAHAREFIDRLVDGIDTVVGDDGVLLSGGQRQRIAIARALLKDAPILILDEATSALDNESERHIQAALQTVMQGRTTLVIAHRLSTIEAADLIVVLDGGQIVEKGTHQELLELDGHYAELHQAQFKDEGLKSRNTRRRRKKRPKTNQGAGVPSTLTFEKSALGLGRVWYQGAWWLHLLRPLSWLYNRGRLRRMRPYETGKKAPLRTNLPVIVVGNVTVGGTGKTPLVAWLVEALRERGFKPGVVMRGYGGKLSKTGTLVPHGADPERYSDEAVQLRDRLGCAVAISAERIKGLRLLEAEGCDVAISDDGLQHYAMARDIEIAVVDGNRGAGNGLMLPAGPLREPLTRLDEVDWVIGNGKASGLVEEETIMSMQPIEFVNVAHESVLTCEQFVEQYSDVRAMCGIGNPSRFYNTLQSLELGISKLTFSDHYNYRIEDVPPPGGQPVVCTEKDAAKLKHLETELSHIWFLRVSVALPAEASSRLDALLEERAIKPKQQVGEA